MESKYAEIFYNEQMFNFYNPNAYGMQ